MSQGADAPLPGTALDACRRAFSHGADQDFVPAAREKYLALRQQYQSDLSALPTQIAASDLGTISQKVATFRKQWSPAADADETKLLEEIDEKRRK